VDFKNFFRTSCAFIASWKHVVFLALATCILWAYWPVLVDLSGRWSTESNYSHGFLVPLFSVFLLYARREGLRDVKAGFYWLGLWFFLAGGVLRLTSAFMYFDWFDGCSLILCLTGLNVLAGGAPALRWAWPALGFLVFMIPLPFQLERALSLPLQRFATQASTYVLQTLGFPALSEGNVILLHNARLGIVQACNGLGMLVAFGAMATGVALVVKRPTLDKLCIMLSAVPVGLVTNVVRISVTGVLHEVVGGEVADIVFHDVAGWFMMPLALGFLLIELRILSLVLVVPKEPPSLPVPFRCPAATSTAGSRPKLFVPGKV
jgi:exosortase